MKVSADGDLERKEMERRMAMLRHEVDDAMEENKKLSALLQDARHGLRQAEHSMHETKRASDIRVSRVNMSSHSADSLSCTRHVPHSQTHSLTLPHTHTRAQVATLERELAMRGDEHTVRIEAAERLRRSAVEDVQKRIHAQERAYAQAHEETRVVEKGLRAEVEKLREAQKALETDMADLQRSASSLKEDGEVRISAIVWHITFALTPSHTHSFTHTQRSDLLLRKSQAREGELERVVEGLRSRESALMAQTQELLQTEKELIVALHTLKSDKHHVEEELQRQVRLTQCLRARAEDAEGCKGEAQAMSAVWRRDEAAKRAGDRQVLLGKASAMYGRL